MTCLSLLIGKCQCRGHLKSNNILNYIGLHTQVNTNLRTDDNILMNGFKFFYVKHLCICLLGNRVLTFKMVYIDSAFLYPSQALKALYMMLPFPLFTPGTDREAGCHAHGAHGLLRPPPNSLPQSHTFIHQCHGHWRKEG